jgi:hypothetical protein
VTDIDTLHPPHDIPPRRPLPTSVLAEWETGTFIENLAPWAARGWWVTIPSHRRVELVAGRTPPSHYNGLSQLRVW